MLSLLLCVFHFPIDEMPGYLGMGQNLEPDPSTMQRKTFQVRQPTTIVLYDLKEGRSHHSSSDFENYPAVCSPGCHLADSLQLGKGLFM